jgi:hypothetical protein
MPLAGYIPDFIYAPGLNYLDEIGLGREATIRSSSINAQAQFMAAERSIPAAARTHPATVSGPASLATMRRRRHQARHRAISERNTRRVLTDHPRTAASTNATSMPAPPKPTTSAVTSASARSLIVASRCGMTVCAEAALRISRAYTRQ